MIGGIGNGKAIAIKGGGAMVLRPGAMIRLNDVDNLRALATKKGLILQAVNNNGRQGVKLVWKSKATAKAAAKAAKLAAAATGSSVQAAQANAIASSAKSMAASADTLAKAAKGMSVPAKVATAGAAKAVSAGTIWTGTGVSLGLGLGLGALGPMLVLSALTASAGGVYVYLRGKRAAEEPPPEY